MKYLYPDYYEDFTCIAGACEATCCAGWDIVIDEKAMRDYHRLPFEKREFVLAGINKEEEVFYRKEGRCAFLNEENLCDLYICAGEKSLCRTCRVYPRHIEEYTTEQDVALSLSCPEAARLIVTRPEKDVWKIKHRGKAIKRPKTALEKRDLVIEKALILVRNRLFAITSDRSLSLSDRMARMLRLLDKVQKLLFRYVKMEEKGGSRERRSWFLSHIREILKNETKSLAGTALPYVKPSKHRYARMKDYTDMLLGLEAINPQWPKLIGDLRTTLYEKMSVEEYMECAEEFREVMKEREYEYEHILNYFLYTYFLGSSYDYYALAMLKLSIVSTLVIRELGMYTWLTQGKTFSEKDQIRVCYLYSRQVEHSDDNLMSLEGLINVHQKFDQRQMLDALP